MKRRALTMGAAVLAVVPLVVPNALCAVAEDVDDTPTFPTWEQWRSLYDYNSTDPTIEFLYGDPVVGVWWKYYYSALMAIVEGVYINNAYEITPGDFSGVSGYYTYNGAVRFGSMYAGGITTYTASADAPGGEVSVWSLQDGSLTVEMWPDNGEADFSIEKHFDGQYLVLDCRRTSGNVGFTTYFRGYGICNTVSLYRPSAYYKWDLYIRFGASSPPEFTTSEAALTTRPGGGYLLGNTASFSALPQNDAYPTITPENARDYVENVLNPYMEEKAPDTVPYLFDPYAVPQQAPTYPVNETWDNEADWPDGNLLPTIPAASYSVDIPEIMTEGASFWWRCLGVLFDGLGITAIVVGLLALGIVLYFVLR